jgi:hypothetical protein
MSDQNIELDKYVIQELHQYLQEARHVEGLRQGLYIIFMRYLQVMRDSDHGIDTEIDSDFLYDFANLLEVLFILRPTHNATDRDVTHFTPQAK